MSDRPDERGGPLAPRDDPPRGVRAIVDRFRADLDTLPTGERAIVAGGLYVLDRCARVVDRMESLVEEQRAGVRRSREILELLSPLIGKLGELLDLEIRDARGRLEDRLRKR